VRCSFSYALRHSGAVADLRALLSPRGGWSVDFLAVGFLGTVVGRIDAVGFLRPVVPDVDAVGFPGLRLNRTVLWLLCAVLGME